MLWLKKMSVSAPPPGTWADIAGLLQPVFERAGLHPAAGAYTPARVLAAPVALVGAFLSWRALTRRDPSLKARWVGALAIATIASGYVMLFNPRTEGNTYAVFAAPAAALLAIAITSRWWTLAAALGAACVGLMFSREITGLLSGDPRGVTNFWVRPLAAIVVLVCLGVMARRWARAGVAGAPAPAGPQV